MSTEEEVFKNNSICKNSEYLDDVAGGYDMTCNLIKSNGIIYCHKICEHYMPKEDNKCSVM